MKATASVASYLSAIAALAHVAPAQAVSEGPYMGFPLHFLVGANTYAAGGTMPLPRVQQFTKDCGFTSLALAAPTGPANPRFTTAAMFGSGLPAAFAIDAISSGYHYIFANPSTLLVDMAGRWGALLFSVTRSSVGNPGSVVHDEATRVGGEGAAADLFSMILPGSTLPPGLSCVPIGVSQRATDSSQMGFAVPATGQKPELGDFDPYITMYDDGPPVRGYLSDDPWVFFSLSNAALANLAVQAMVTPWFVTNPAAMNGATILRMQWDSTAATPHWRTPEIHLSSAQLGLTDPNDDIDALAVDEARNLVLFSLRYDPARPTTDRQLMIASWIGTPFLAGTATPYKYQTPAGPQNVVDLTGIVATDDIDATCEEDPGNGAAIPLSRAYIRYCGLPMAPGIPVGLSGSVHRGTPGGAGVSTYYVSVDGLGGVTDAANFVALVVSLSSLQGSPYSGPAVTLFVRPPLNQLGYETVPYSVPLLQPNTATWGVALDFQWGALGNSTTVVSPLLRVPF